MRMLVLAVMVLAAGAGAAHAQPYLEAVELVPINGRLTLVFDTPIDAFNIYLSRIHMEAGEYGATFTTSEFVNVRTYSITLQLDGEALEAARATESVLVRLDEGAITSSGVPNAPHQLETGPLIQVGVVAPPGHEDLAAMARLAATHLSTELADSDPPQRISVLVQDGDDILASLLELDGAGVDVMVGPGSVLDARRDLSGSMVLIACCTPYADESLLNDANSFALVPDALGGLSPILSLMGDIGVSRIIPVYPDDYTGNAMLGDIQRGARSAVDAGLGYDPQEPGDVVALRLSRVVEQNMVDYPDARLGILLTDPADAPSIMETASLYAVLSVPQWFGAYTHQLTDDQSTEFAAAVEYSAPLYGAPRSDMTALLGAQAHDMTGLWPSYSSYSAYDAVYLAALIQLGYDGSLQDAMRMLARNTAGVSGYLGMDGRGGLESPSHDIVTVRGGQWVRTAVHNHPVYEPAGMRYVEGVPVESRLYSSGDNTIASVEQVGLLVSGYETAPAHLAALLGAASGRAPADEVILRDSESIPDMMVQFAEMGVGMVLLHAGESATSEAAEYAEALGMASLATASISDDLAASGDGLYRMLPPAQRLAVAVAHTLERDEMQGVVALYESGRQPLLDGVVAGFAGEVSAIEYEGDNPVPAANRAASSVREMVQRYGENGTAVLLLDDGHAADMLGIVSTYVVLDDIRWYGAGPDASAFETGDKASFAERVSYTVITPSVSGSGPAQLASAPLAALYDHPVPVPVLGVMEGSRLASNILSVAYRLTGGHDAGVIGTVLNSSNSEGLVLGYTALDANGDPASDSHDIWSVRENVWVRHATHEPSSGYLDVVNVGVAAPVTGDHAGYGLMQVHAAHLAISGYNSQLAGDGESWRLSGVVADTASDPAGALESLRGVGIRAVLGPPDGASLEAAAPVAEDLGMTMLSCCSDWPDSHANNTLRLSPGQGGQVAALDTMMLLDKIQHLIILYPNDTRGSSLAEGISAEVTNRKIDRKTVTAMQVVYDAAAPPSDDLMRQVANEVRKKTADSSVGVLVGGFEHTGSIMERVELYPGLENARWYGVSRDGILPHMPAGSEAIISAGNLGLTVAAQAALLSSPGLDTYVREATGFEPYVGVQAMYDSVNLLGTVISRLGGAVGDAPLAEFIHAVAVDKLGLLGSLELDEDGDLYDPTYDIWTIRDYSWQAILEYNVRTGSVK